MMNWLLVWRTSTQHVACFEADVGLLRPQRLATNLPAHFVARYDSFQPSIGRTQPDERTHVDEGEGMEQRILREEASRQVVTTEPTRFLGRFKAVHCAFYQGARILGAHANSAWNGYDLDGQRATFSVACTCNAARIGKCVSAETIF